MNGRTLTIAKAIGADLEEDTSGLWAYAPAGYHFKASGTATLTHGYIRGQFKTEANADMVADLRDGLEPCDEAICKDAGHWGEEHPNA
jgi:hypothetical protein